MAFKSNIPQAADQISISQADLLNNFAAINTFTAKDHYAFGSPNEGGHYFTTGAAPAVGDATHVGIYAALLGGDPELYINKAASQIPFTAALKNGSGWTYLPSGIIIQWGSATQIAGQKDTNYTTPILPIAFPTAMLSIVGTPYDTPTGAYDDIIMAIVLVDKKTFKVKRKTHFGTDLSFTFIAIGY